MTRPTATYDELDAAIVKAIGDGKTRFCEIWPPLSALASMHITAPYGGPDRVVDRRLQSLRKRRLITYWKGKWRPGNDR